MSGMHTPTIRYGRGRFWLKAGYPEGFEFEFLVAKMGGIPEAPDIGEAMVPYFRAVGLKPELQEMTFGNLGDHI